MKYLEVSWNMIKLLNNITNRPVTKYLVTVYKFENYNEG